MAALEGVNDQLLRFLGVGDTSIELCDLALGQATPCSTSPAPAGELVPQSAPGRYPASASPCVEARFNVADAQARTRRSSRW
jgi:hypothetical protein